jgi:anion-transporting  ArsA/GET3 family ATPase
MQFLIKKLEGQANDPQQVILAPQRMVLQNTARFTKRLQAAISPIHGRSGGVLKKREYPDDLTQTLFQNDVAFACTSV